MSAVKKRAVHEIMLSKKLVVAPGEEFMCPEEDIESLEAVGAVEDAPSSVKKDPPASKSKRKPKKKPDPVEAKSDPAETKLDPQDPASDIVGT